MTQPRKKQGDGMALAISLLKCLAWITQQTDALTHWPSLTAANIAGMLLLTSLLYRSLPELHRTQRKIYVVLKKRQRRKKGERQFRR